MDRLKILLMALFCFLGGHLLLAQKGHRPYQVSLVSPIGTNGAASAESVNNFSFNILYGRSAGVQGAEVGGLINHASGEVSGFQMAGLGNFSQTTRGAQYAGLFNISSEFKGLQIAGLLNVNAGEGSSSQGAQLAGIVNRSAFIICGAEVAGIVNLQTDSIQGFQMAGIANLAREVNGVQLAGVLNKASIVSGVQIGLINIAHEVQNGVQIGLVNISGNGYKKVEVEYNESFYLNLNYKMGTRPLYSVWSMAYRNDGGKKLWAVGYGLGTYHQIGINTAVNIDAIHLFVNEDEWWTKKLNTIDKFKFTTSLQITPGFEVYGGGSLNLKLSKLKNDEGQLKGSLLDTPKALYDQNHHNTHIMIYPGFHAGVRF